MTVTVESKSFNSFPYREVNAIITDTKITAAGIAVAAANFPGLAVLDDVVCRPIQETGAVNTKTVIGKYDSATGLIFFFYGNDAAAEIPTDFVVITGDIAVALTMRVVAYGRA